MGLAHASSSDCSRRHLTELPRHKTGPIFYLPLLVAYAPVVTATVLRGLAP